MLNMNRDGRWGRLLATLALGFVLTVAGCGGDDGGTDLDADLQAAWNAFLAGDFAGARAQFGDILAANPGLLEANLGYGWASGFTQFLADAETALEAVVAADPTQADAWAGLAVIRLAMDDAAGAITAGQELLNRNAAWQFEFRSSVDADDVRLAMAQAYVSQGEDSFDEAQALLDVLDPTNGLDPLDDATWVVGGITYDTYAAALIQALQLVEEDLGETQLF
jgi:hypothetical protein